MKEIVRYICGHEETVQMTGSAKDREKKIKYLKKYCYCSECSEKKQREKTEGEKAVDTKEGLPELEGSEKRVDWARALRRKFIDECKQKNMPNELQYLYEYILQNVVDSTVWINNRFNLLQLFPKYKEEAAAAATREKDEQVKDVIDNIKEEAAVTITPEKAEHSGTVTVTATDKAIQVKYEYNPEFVEIMKKHHLKYENGKWSRQCNKFTGSPIDRAAEITNALLASGFAVKVNDGAIKEIAIAADFKPECRRWVSLLTSGNYAGYLAISFDRDDELYDKARGLPKSRWHNRQMVVPIDCYKEVLDFADMLGFQVSDGAATAIEQYRASLLPPISVKTPKKPEETDKLSKILQSSADVLPDLKDD